MPSLTHRVRTRLTINQVYNYLESRIVRKLNLIPFGNTKVNGVERSFYYIDLALVSGFLGAEVRRLHYRGVMVVASDRVKGLVVGSDLVRKGRLIVDIDAVTFCV
jgi:hypothetical protein